MWPLITIILIELCGSTSFHVRQCASACLLALDNVPIRAIECGESVPVTFSVLDQRCLKWGWSHDDPEIRERVKEMSRWRLRKP